MSWGIVKATNRRLRAVAKTVAEHGGFTLTTDDLGRGATKHGINFGTFSAYYYQLKKNPDLYREALNGHAPAETETTEESLVVDEGAKLMGRFLTATRRIKELEREVERLRGFLTLLVDDEECQRDHHGYCQTHHLEAHCTVAAAREYLAALSGRPTEGESDA